MHIPAKYILPMMVSLCLCSSAYAHEPKHTAKEPVSDMPDFFKEFTLINKVSLFSEYYTRGLSQTQEMPAPQFESTLVHSSGILGGIFVSRVEYFDGDQADQELDYFIAYQQTLENGLYYRIGGIYYTFPNAQSRLKYDFWELDVALGYDFGPLYSELYLRTSPDHYASSGHSRYVRLAARVPIHEKLRIKSHIAHRYIEDNQTFFGIPDAFDWELGFEYTVIDNTDVMVRYVDSSFSQQDCLNSDFCSGRVVFGASYSF